MTPPPPPSRPSAADGYRRLVHPRTAAMTGTATHSTPAEDTTAPGELGGRSDRPGARRRLLGALRLAGMVAMLAVVVGTSVNLASADTADTGAPDTGSVSPDTSQVADTDTRAADDSVTEAEADTSAAQQDDGTPAATAATAATATEAAEIGPRAARTTNGTRLPLTGPEDLPNALLLGALFVLLGMSVQIAGQPHSRRHVVRNAARNR